MTNKRKAEIRKSVKEQILFHLDEAVAGSEMIMKECWENCINKAELSVADKELERIRDVVSAL